MSRSGLDIMKELLAVTNEMVRRREDDDYLIRSVETRQKLMDEYDSLQGTTALTPQESDEVKRIAREIAGLDGILTSALTGHREHMKKQLALSTHHQRVVGYMSNASSVPGIQMDYKE